jgi:hypothetical protein
MSKHQGRAERVCPEARGLSRRDGPIVAWHEVPGKSSSEESRPVGYGLIRVRAGERTDSSDWRIGVTKFRHTDQNTFVRYYFYLTSLKKHGTHFGEKYLWD